MKRTNLLAGAILAAVLLPTAANAENGNDATPRDPKADQPVEEQAAPDQGSGTAETPPVEGTEVDLAALKAAVEAKLEWKTGDVVIGDQLATLKLGEGWRYLGPEQASFVLTEVWGNPPGPPTLGMVFPSDVGPMDDEGWGVILTYEQDGYVKDDDASDIDYDELLAEMQQETQAGNEERRAMGYGTVDLVGWAERPRYDASAKKLYWAKELKFEGSEENTLNYDVRILGRRGYLVMQAVAAMPLLARVRDGMKTVLEVTEFNSGHRYEDFDPELDQVAAFGIGALVAGKLAAKTGMFAALVAVVLKAKKLLILAVVGLIALVGKRMGKKS